MRAHFVAPKGMRFQTTDRIQQQFGEFHRAHPEVYRILVEKSREYKKAGVHVGIAHVFEITRYFLWIGKSRSLDSKPSVYKLNNNYRSRYARLIMDMEEDLAGYFETRPLRSSNAAIDLDLNRDINQVSGIDQVGRS